MYIMYNLEVKFDNNNIILKNASDFDLRHIFDCGQCFRFERESDDTYFGIAFGRALRISQKDGIVTLYDTPAEDFKNIWYDFFDLDCDYGELKKRLATDDYMKSAVKYGGGIRILRQDLWETLISFIISASNNIPRIKGIIERLCSNFGEKISYMGGEYYSFPTAQRLAQLTKDELSVIRAGFRDKYILDAARKIADGEISLDSISGLPTCEAKAELMKISGVGNKVSDCILLFGLHRTDSFPVDVWIKRIMEYCYFGEEASIKEISVLAEKKFGELGGFAQQYLFFWARDNKIGTGG